MSTTKIREKVNSIAELRALVNIPVGKVIETDSYYGDGNGGGSVYECVDTSVGSYIDDGGGFIIGSDNRVYQLTVSDDKVTSMQYGIKGDNTLLTATEIENFLKYCSLNNLTAFFTSGTYLFPYDLEIEIDNGNLDILGEGKDITVITSDNSDSNTFRKPKKIDLKKDPATYPDGIYYVFGTQIANDGTNDYHASYPAGIGLNHFVAGSKDNYIQIASGVPTIKTQAEITALNWVSYLDLTLAAVEPTEDGIYECSIAEWSISGVIQPVQLPWEAGLNPTQGSAVLNTGGTWTRYNPKLGIQFYKDLKVRDIKFEKTAFFLFNFLGLETGRVIDIQNCKFSNIRRLIATDRSANGWFGASLNNKSVKDGLNYNFDLVDISNNDFDRVSEGVFWGTPTIYRSKFNNNNYVDCDNLVSVFNQLHWTTATGDTLNYYYDNATSEIKNNTHTNCVNMSSDKAQVQRQWYRFLSNTVYDGNKFENSNGVACFPSLTNNRITNNYFNSFCDVRGSYSLGALIIQKLAPTNYHIKNVIQSNIVKQHYSHFLYIDFDNEYDINNNEYTNMTYIESCYSLTTELDRNITYKVLDLTTFQTLAVNYQNDSGDAIAYDDLVRFNFQQNRWIKSEGFSTVREVYGKNTDEAAFSTNIRSVYSSDNKYRANSLVRLTGLATTDTKTGFYFDGDQYKINSFLPVTIDQPIYDFSLKNTDIYITQGSGTSPNSMCLNELTLENIKFYLALNSILIIEHNEDVFLNNVSALPWNEFYNDDYFTDTGGGNPPAQETLKVLTSGVSKRITVEGGVFHIGTSRNMCLRSDGFTECYLKGSTFNMETLNDLTSYHNGTGFEPINNNPDIVEISDSTIIVNNQGKEVFLLDFNTTVNVCNLFSNKTMGSEDLEAIFTSARTVGTLNISQKGLLPTVKADPYNGSTIATLNEIDVVYPVDKTGSSLDLSNPLGTPYNVGSASASTVYTTINEVIMGNAVCLINTTSEPTVTGGTKTSGATWVTGTDMYMVVWSPDGINVEFYFLEI